MRKRVLNSLTEVAPSDETESSRLALTITFHCVVGVFCTFIFKQHAEYKCKSSGAHENNI